MDMMGTLAQALPKYIAFLFALCFHEYAHGYIAQRRGDQTANLMGRLTLNPMAHADIIGTVILPMLAFVSPGMFLIGWAKPVPVNPGNLKNPRVDMFWIALAGPLSNVLLALISTVVLGFSFKFFGGDPSKKVLFMGLSFFMQINLFLAVFNLIPIHPLDGGKVLARFLPEEMNRRLEENQFVIGMLLMVLIFSGMLSFLFMPAYWAYNGLVSVAEIIAQF